MHRRPHRLVLFLALVMSACTSAGSRRHDAVSPEAPASADAATPMASFARLVGGEWRVTLASGVTGYHAWRWGPGRFSMRRMTCPSDAVSNPWQGEVLYWHPGLGQVRMLSLHEDIPGVGRGVGEGTIRFEGETTEAVLDLDQHRGRRKLGQRQVFSSPDEYHEILLEDAGAGLQPLNALDFVRVEERARLPSPNAEPAILELPERWKPFEALLDGTWTAEGAWAGEHPFRVQSTFEWAPSLEVVFASVVSSNAEGQAAPWLDVYLYRHVRDDALRCLALSQHGGVYVGGVSVLEDGALQLDLTSYERDEVASLSVRFDFEPTATLRQRVWWLANSKRELVLDVRHKRLGSVASDR